jgi:MFS transporter, ACS family, hexuronate transporter
MTPDSPRSTAVSFFEKWGICLLLLLATTLNYMDRQALSLTGVRVSKDFGIHEGQYSYLAGVFNIGFGIGALTFGWLADRGGNLRWIYAGLVLAWSAVGFATGFVESFAPLLLCRLLLGLFESGNWPCGILVVKRVCKPEERSLGNGMFQSGTAIGAILMPLVVMLCYRLSDPDAVRAWQVPFRVIGLCGAVWVLAWLALVSNRHVAAPPPPAPPAEPVGDDQLDVIVSPQRSSESDGSNESFWALWLNRRFWLMVVVVIGLNAPWRTLAEWLPMFLEKEKGYSEEAAQMYTSAYYFAADAGSIVAGVLTLWLARRGWPLFTARMLAFFLCASLTLLLIAVVLLPKGWWLFAALLLVGFGTLGSFASYYALSQEVSSRHQAKFTGTLGLLNAICMGSLAVLQGDVIRSTKSYALPIGLTAVAPFVAMLSVLFFWNWGKPRVEA